MSADSDPVPPTSEVVALYGAAWQEPGEDARRALLERAWAEDGVYVDPTVVVRGREALVAHLGGFQERMRDHSLVLTTGVDERLGWLRFGWNLLAPDGELVLEGQDFGELDGDGRLRLIVGFFGPAAPA
ncbi:MAG: hypothetical protein QOJ89_2369 [bacterium]|jgi:hypothetical protein